MIAHSGPWSTTDNRSVYAKSLDTGGMSMQQTLQTGSFNPMAGTTSPDQLAAMQDANNFDNGINTGAALGMGSSGKYMGRSFDPAEGSSGSGGGGGIAPQPQAQPQRPPLGTPMNYNPAARDAALRQLASAPTPAPAPTPAARTPSARAPAAGNYTAEWDRLDRQGR